MRFFQVDVFAEGPYTGNPLAVFPGAGDLTGPQMQAIAREMNLSETSFVIAVDRDGYDARIFTPQEELPFAGHPTIGTAWLLEHVGAISGSSIVQRTAAGDTPLTRRDGLWWFERDGKAEADVDETKPGTSAALAGALAISEEEIGLEAREFGRPGRLLPAYSDSGLSQLMVPVKNVEALARCSPRLDLLAEIGGMGAYCVTAERAGYLRTRGFWPGVGVGEDPATGSACAALGVYLADRLGDVDLQVTQGIEMGRPSAMKMRASKGRASIGGACALIFEGTLQALP
ncbi:MAG: PhzF family phenazine biosynthesis protein [Actinobacteria bacterium]|nr:PhzF family phenazine biosynthesis protein [Actinomycetota bacterium]